ncbi:MAG: caspase family protein [Anaerolineae bacterium]|nr:caspase family protein [Anaerolineae bacterium]
MAVTPQQLNQFLNQHFSIGELQTLCFELDIPYEDLEGGEARSAKALALVKYAQRHGVYDTLVTHAQAQRPNARLGDTAVVPTHIDRVIESGAKGSEVTVSTEVYGKGNRWAVLVGVNKYDDWHNYSKLQVCVQDVVATRDALIASGYDPQRIRLITDEGPEEPGRANIITALKAVADATEPDDSLLFYYSGHGAEFNKESYLVARDGRKLTLSDTAVAISRVKEIITAAPARAKIIILDACHSGADIGKGSEPMSPEFVRRVFAEAEGLVILSSCTQGQLSYEWPTEKKSVFTHYLLEAMSGTADRDKKGFVTMQDASRHVVNGVKLWAANHNTSQTPTLQSQVAGDIILADYQESAL